jgi:hypothetical protein
VERLAFHHLLYSARAIDESLQVFSEHAQIVREERMPYFELEITAPDDERSIASELANYVLALTIEERRSGA